MSTTYLTDAEIIVINQARTILDAIAHRMHREQPTHEGGMVHEAAHRAADSCFDLLNVVHSYGRQPLNHEQLHGRPAPSPVEAS